MTNYNKRLANITPEILSRIARIDEIKGHWTSGVNLSPQLLGRLKQSVLVTSSAASTRIEGSLMSDEDVENAIKGLKITKFRDRDRQEAQSYYELLKNIFDAWPTIPFNESSIKHLHKEMLKYVEKDARHRGDYKKLENNVSMVDADGKEVGIVFKTTPAYLAPKQMQELMDWIVPALREKKNHPLLLIGGFLIEFLKIHPFQDGNGRLSRTLTNLLLLKSGYAFVPYVSQEKIVEDTKMDYYLALRKSQKSFGTAKENVGPWLEYFLRIVELQAEQAVALLSTENIEILLSAKQLAVWNCIASAEYASTGEIVKKTKVARPTVNQALEKLLSMNKIEKIGLGRATRYRAIN
ncbi:MAG: Fic family protein [Candidatus Falkowbacteria bacterium]